MKKRLLKKAVLNMSHATPARFRNSDRVKREWVRRFDESIPPHLRSDAFGLHWDYDGAGKPVRCSFGQWVFYYEFRPWHRQIARTSLGVSAEVSTVLLGINQSWLYDEERPIIFETMVLGGPLHHERDRYSTLAEARAGHANLVERCQQALDALLLPFVRDATPESPIKREDFPGVTNSLDSDE